MAEAMKFAQPVSSRAANKEAMTLDLLPDFMPIATEKGCRLALFANQDSEIFFDQLSPAVDDLARQYAKGLYEPKLALRAFQRVATAAAVLYERIHGDANMAEKGLSTHFTRLDQEDAGAQLLVMNVYILEDAIWEAVKRRGCLG